jgi:ribosomal protein L11 methyltransferase
MHEIALEVAAEQLEALIDRVVAAAPYGLFDSADGERGAVRIRAPDGELPPASEFVRLAAGIDVAVTERELPDSWSERRLLDYVPKIVAGVCVRPEWAPVTAGTIDVAISETAEFGSGMHPTTRDSIILLADCSVRGRLADLGCGSGVLSIAAAKMGFGTITAVDVREAAVLATRVNAELNHVELAAVEAADLLAEPAPYAPIICANVPSQVHEAIAATMVKRPRILIASGIQTLELDSVVSAYGRAGLELRNRLESHGWVTCAFESPAVVA